MTERKIKYERIIQAAGSMSACINLVTEGEEMEDLLRRQLAIITQLLATIGCSPKHGFESLVVDGIAMAHDNKIKFGAAN